MFDKNEYIISRYNDDPSVTYMKIWFIPIFYVILIQFGPLTIYNQEFKKFSDNFFAKIKSHFLLSMVDFLC